MFTSEPRCETGRSNGHYCQIRQTAATSEGLAQQQKEVACIAHTAAASASFFRDIFPTAVHLRREVCVGCTCPLFLFLFLFIFRVVWEMSYLLGDRCPGRLFLLFFICFLCLFWRQKVNFVIPRPNKKQEQLVDINFLFKKRKKKIDKKMGIILKQI